MYQKIIVVGYLGRDPEMRYMADGTAVTNFNIATSRRWTDRNSGQTNDETTWFRVSVWGKRAETANQYLKKGSRVLVEGRLQPDPQTGGPRLYTRQDGTVGSSFELRAFTFTFMSGRDEDTSSFSSGDGESTGGDTPAQEEDEIPF